VITELFPFFFVVSRKTILVFLAFCGLAFAVRAQEDNGWKNFVRDMYEQHQQQHEELIQKMVEDRMESDEPYDPDELYEQVGQQIEEQFSEWIDTLYQFYLHPINLNELVSDTARKGQERGPNEGCERLRKLTFLSNRQVEGIIDYVGRNYPVRSLGELMLIPELDFSTRSYLPLFCTVGNLPSHIVRLPLSTILSRARHLAFLRADFPFYIKEGYRSRPLSEIKQSPNKIYRGNNSYHSLRYEASTLLQRMSNGIASPKLTIGFQTEKDAGDPEFDYLSFHIMFNNISVGNKKNFFRTILVGDYKLNWGLGLTVNNGMSFGKTEWNGFDKGVTRHSSMSEANHFRGVATEVRLAQRLDFTAAFSYQSIDATLRSVDDVKSPLISSLKTDGLHRTLLERSKKGNVDEMMVGGHIKAYFAHWNLGLSVVASHLSIPLLPKSDTDFSRYRQYFPQGNGLGCASVHYSYITHTIRLMGEVARSWSTAGAPNRGWGMVNTLKYQWGGNTQLMAAARYYEPRFATFYGRSLGENSRPQNEYGLMVGLSVEPARRIHLEGYIDVFHFPEQRYRVSRPSSGFESLCKMTYQPASRTEWQFRYKVKNQQRDCTLSDGHKQPFNFIRHDARVQLNRQANQHILLKSTLSAAYLMNADSPNGVGYALSQLVRWDGRLWKAAYQQRIQFMLTYFHTDDYAVRVYATEPTQRFSMGFKSYYGHGIRSLLMFSSDIGQHFSLTAKITGTHYFDRDQIGTGLEAILQRYRHDAVLQLKIKY